MPKQENLFNGNVLSKSDRLAHLESVADVVENLEFVKKFTAEEQAELNNSYVEKQKDILRLTKKMKALVDPIKTEIKSKKAEMAYEIEQLNDGGIRTNEQVYGIADYENNVMDLYDENGEFVSSRRLTVQERQTTLQAEIRLNVSNQ